MQPLKDLLDDAAVRALARDLRRAHAPLDERSFVAAGLHGLEARSLSERAIHLAEVMHRHLPADFPAAAQIVEASLGPVLPGSEVFGMAVLRYLPHVHFVARHGLDHFEPSMQLQLAVTRRFSAEFSIRAFILRHPARTYERLTTWTADPDVHVRRLVSEGTRPRLPWAERLRDYQRDPTPVLALLERLKDDPERYVQRSVANNLNDIAKDHPQRALDTCARWSRGASESRAWIVRHALRSLIKQGDRGALALVGAAEPARVAVRGLAFTPGAVHLGETLQARFDLLSTADAAQELVVDYAVHYVKARGAPRPKVFKLRRLGLEPRAAVPLTIQVSFADMTTRKHYPGTHRLELRVNGEPLPLGEFEVRPARASRRR